MRSRFEMGDLFEELVVLERRRAPGTHRALRLIVGNRMPLPIGEGLVAAGLLPVVHDRAPCWLPAQQTGKKAGCSLTP